MENNKEWICYYDLGEDIRKYLRQTGVVKGLINLLAMLYSAAENIAKEEREKLINEKEK